MGEGTELGGSGWEAPDGDTVDAPQGFGERVGGSFGSLLVGLVFVPLACIGLFWNEGHSVRVANALIETQGKVQTVPTTRRDPAFDGKPVHVAGNTTSAKGIADDAFGIHAKALKLSRVVEMYQWKESESGSGDNRKFTYSKRWESSPISSSSFHDSYWHANPPFPSYRSKDFGASDAAIEGYPVGSEAALQLRAAKDFAIDGAGLAKAQAMAGRQARVEGGLYYVGSNPAAPRIGDIRVFYRIEPEGPASFIGLQGASGLQAYRASNGEEVLLGYAGTHSADAVIQKGIDDNAFLTWLLRGLGLLFLWVGFVALFAPINLLASYVPILGSIVEGATWLVATVATIVVGPSVIAFAWLAYRPFFSLGLIAAALAVGAGLYVLRRRRGRSVGLAEAPATA